MKRRQDASTLADASAVPCALLAGRCVEVWGGPDHCPYRARRNYAEACDRYLRGLGIDPWGNWRDRPDALKKQGRAWSFEIYAQDPEKLADKLARVGLPPDWKPSPADPDDFGEPGPLARRWS